MKVELDAVKKMLFDVGNIEISYAEICKKLDALANGEVVEAEAEWTPQVGDVVNATESKDVKIVRIKKDTAYFDTGSCDLLSELKFISRPVAKASGAEEPMNSVKIFLNRQGTIVSEKDVHVAAIELSYPARYLKPEVKTLKAVAS